MNAADDIAAAAPATNGAASLDAVELERLTARRYLLAMVFQGLWWAGYLLLPFVLAKSLQAPGWLVTLAVTLEASSSLLALYWGQLLMRGGRRRWLIRGGIGGRVVMVLMLAVRTPMQFVLLLAVVYFFASLVSPAQNGILQANISRYRRGVVFGRGALVQHATAAVTSLALGVVLDRDSTSYRWLFPLLGCAGFVFMLILARLPRPVGDTTHDPARWFVVPRLPLGPVRLRRLAGALVTPFREAAATYRRDRRFLWFEIDFMLYGLAYMMLIPVVPLFFTDRLRLDYREISNARVLIASLGVALLSPLAGRLMDRFHPVRVSTASFAIIAFYPVALAVGAAAPGASPALVAYCAFAVYAVAMSGINMTWNVGSISFAPSGQGSYYQGIHVAMVGIRGVLGPVIGFVVLRLMGYRQVFVLAALFFLLAAASSWLLGRRLRDAD